MGDQRQRDATEWRAFTGHRDRLAGKRCRRRRSLQGVVVVALVTGLSIVGLTSAGPAAGAQANPAALQFGPGTIAEFLASLAKEPARNFLLEQIGVKTTGSQLRSILDKLNQLQGQLTEVEARLSAQINELKLVIQTDFLGDTAVDLQKLFDGEFAALGSAIARYQAARDLTPPDPVAVQSAKEAVDRAKANFISKAQIDKVDTLAAKIHNRLQPRLGTDGVTVVYGKDIMANHRILTHVDSERVHALYSFLEENQALAAWMSAEYWLASNEADGLAKAKKELDEFLDPQNGFVAIQRDGGRPNGQHAPIPVGMAIDRGPDADVNTYTTANKSIFTPAGLGYQWIPTNRAWGNRFEDLATNMPAVIKRLNAEKFRDVDGWSVPSGAQIDGLFSILPASERNRDGITAYLQKYFGADKAFDVNFTWISDTDSSSWGPVHRSFSASDLGKFPQPTPSSLPLITDPDGEPRATVTFFGTSGGLIAVRSTGRAQYLP